MRAVCDRAECVAELDEVGVAVLDLKVRLALVAAVAVTVEIPRLARPEKEFCGRDERHYCLPWLVVQEHADHELLVAAALEDAVDRDRVDEAEVSSDGGRCSVAVIVVAGRHGHAAASCRVRHSSL